MPVSGAARPWRTTFGALVLALAGAVAAHEADAQAALPWTAQAPLRAAQALLLLAWALYAWGSARVRPPLGRRAGFHATMLLAALALFGPLDEWAAHSAAWHMTQHMLLITVIAPLLVLARPLACWRSVMKGAADRLWRGLAQASRRPLACAMLHAAAIWFWHAPVPYVAALQHSGLHMLEHACFLFTGWLFWWSVLRPSRGALLPAALALVFTATHTGMLGALLTFAPEPLYGEGQGALPAQQLAGLLMWVPGGILYLGAAAVAGFRWLAAIERASIPRRFQRGTAQAGRL